MDELPLRVFPAAPAITHPVQGPGWVAVGDAALQHDPLEGRGALRALAFVGRAAAAALLPPRARGRT